MKNLILLTLAFTSIFNFLFANSTEKLFSPVLQTQLITPEGNIIAAGYLETEGGQDLCLVKYLSNGELDPFFGVSGYFILDLPNSNEQAFGLTCGPEGNIFVCGQSIHGLSSQILVCKITEDGSLDKRFAKKGILREDINHQRAKADQICIFNDHIYLTGIAQKEHQLWNFLSPISLKGKVDKASTIWQQNLGSNNSLQCTADELYWLSNKELLIFDKNHNLQHQQEGAKAIALRPDGKFWLADTKASWASSSFRLLLCSKELGQEATYYFDFEQYDYAEISHLSLSPEGKILMGGTVSTQEEEENSDLGIIRLTSEAELDYSFADQGFWVKDFAQEGDYLTSVHAMNENDIFILGQVEHNDHLSSVVEHFQVLAQ